MIINNILLGIILLFILYVLHKLRKVHLMNYDILNKLDEQKTDNINLFRQIQAYDALQKKLDLKNSLPPLRAWAASPDFLLTIANHATTSNAEVIVECSSGSSTVTLARCLQLQGKGHVYSLEHDEHYANKTRNELKKNGLEDWATVLVTPLTEINDTNTWYDLTRIPNIPQIDMLVIDGPPSFVCKNSRYPAIPELKEHFNKTTVFLDDADRTEERNIIELWQSENTLEEFTEHDCEKGCVSFVISQ